MCSEKLEAGFGVFLLAVVIGCRVLVGATLEEAAFTASVEKGRTMTMEQAIAYALAESSS